MTEQSIAVVSIPLNFNHGIEIVANPISQDPDLYANDLNAYPDDWQSYVPVHRPFSIHPCVSGCITN